MERADQARLLPLVGWAQGFFSGVAQATGVDFLHNISSQDLMARLYNVCQSQPTKPLSVAAEEIAKALISDSGK